MDERFVLVGIRPPEPARILPRRRRRRDVPVLSLVFLAVVILGCVFCRYTAIADPAYMDLSGCSLAPGPGHPFGTDAMGRDIFSMIWYGGRVSLTVGVLAAAVSAAIALVAGALCGLGPDWLDGLVMRLTELLLSVPSLLLVMLLQAAMGRSTVTGIALAVGLTSWMGTARVVRAQARQLRRSGFVVAARCMGAGFFHTLRRHLAPNFFPSILFMTVMNIRGAIMAESTLSFLGVGLPLEVISWGSMLSLAENALTGGTWWIVLIPGLTLVCTLLAITETGEWLRRRGRGSAAAV